MSGQPRRKYPRRAPVASSEDVHQQQQQKPIERLGDITDAEFAPKTAFVEITSKPTYIIMEDVSDRSLSARRRRAGKDASPGQFGLQTPNFEGKKGSVKNWRPLVKAEESSAVVESYDDLWRHLKEATDRVFQGQNVGQPFESLYNKVELICVNKHEATVFKDLQSSFRLHINAWMSSIESLAGEKDDQHFLQYMEEQWQELCRKIKLIRCIFLVLDRTYCLQKSDIPSIWDMGIAMCRDCVVKSTTEGKIFDGLLKAVERERNGDLVDRRLLKNVTRMLSDLSLYETGFEDLFIKATKSLYSVESQQNIQSQDIASYLKYVSRRLEEEENRFEIGMDVGYLQISTRKKLIPTVEQELIQSHQSAMIAKGTDTLIDGNRIADMTLMYQLLARTPAGLQELCRAFCEYIKKRGRVIVMDEAQDKDMIPSMLDLKSKTEDILQQCFKSHSIFKDAAREGFEHFINQRHNKPAEMIAKFVDSKLKTGNKEVTEEELDRLMDRLLILFRYIHGKDVFEAFYKKDLAKRLLLQLSASVDSEKLMLQKLKTECGSAFTSRLEGMFRDIEMSKEHMTVFEGKPDHPKRTAKSAAIDFAVSVLTQGIWPNYLPSEVTLPVEMTQYLTAFQQFYVAGHNGRKLQWLANLGQCRLNGNYQKGKKEFQVSQLQAVVLLLFNNVDELTLAEIGSATQIEPEELKRVMGSLSFHKSVVVLKKSGNQQTISANDNFTFNADFTHKNVRVKINAIQAQETPEEEQKTQEGVLADRQYQIDAAIVRIMKTRKSLKHALLMAEIYKQLRFPVTPNDLKKRIESLIERDYMARDREDQTTFNYVA